MEQKAQGMSPAKTTEHRAVSRHCSLRGVKISEYTKPSASAVVVMPNTTRATSIDSASSGELPSWREGDPLTGPATACRWPGRHRPSEPGGDLDRPSGRRGRAFRHDLQVRPQNRRISFRDAPTLSPLEDARDNALADRVTKELYVVADDIMYPDPLRSAGLPTRDCAFAKPRRWR